MEIVIKAGTDAKINRSRWVNSSSLLDTTKVFMGLFIQDLLWGFMISTTMKIGEYYIVIDIRDKLRSKNYNRVRIPTTQQFKNK